MAAGRNKVDIYYFLNTPEGQSLGGLDAGQIYLEDELHKIGIDLRASLLKQTGSSFINDRMRLRSENVIFTDSNSDLKKKAYLLIDPAKQPQGFNMPNITVRSFNGSIEQSYSSFDFIKPKFFEFKSKFSNGITDPEVLKKSQEIARKNKEEREERIRQAEIQRVNKEKQDAEERRKNIETNRKVWKEGTQRKDSNTPYFNKKGMNDIHELMYIKTGFDIVPGHEDYRPKIDMVPLFNIEGEFLSYQKYTHADNKKMIAKDMPSKSVFNIIGSSLNDIDNHERIHFSEGLATGYKVHKATNEPVVFCLNAMNLYEVIKDFREKYPEKEFLIAADNDKYKYHSGNAGLRAAVKCSIDFNAGITYPEFDPKDDHKRLTDWDDYHDLYGENAMKKSYNNPSNTFNLYDASLRHRDAVSRLYEIKYAPSDAIFGMSEEFLLPKGDGTSPKVFSNRLSILQNFIPDHAFKKNMGKESVNGKSVYNFMDLPGKHINELSMDDIINNNQKEIKLLDENSKSFFDKINPYIEIHRKQLNQYIKNKKDSKKDIDFDRHDLTPKESKDIMVDPYFLKKGKKCLFTSMAPLSLTVKDDFFVDNMKFVKEGDNFILSSVEGLNRNGKGKPLSLVMNAEKRTVSEWEAIGDGQSSIKDVAKLLRSKNAYSKRPEMSSITYDKREIPLDRVTIDESVFKKLSEYVLKNDDHQVIKQKKHNNEWKLTHIQTFNEKKNNRDSYSPSL